MKKQNRYYKLRLPLNGPYLLLLKRIHSCRPKYDITNQELIKFDPLFSKVCPAFSIKGKQLWEWIFLLNDIGLITIVAGHGIKVNYTFQDNELMLQEESEHKVKLNKKEVQE